MITTVAAIVSPLPSPKAGSDCYSEARLVLVVVNGDPELSNCIQKCVCVGRERCAAPPLPTLTKAPLSLLA